MNNIQQHIVARVTHFTKVVNDVFPSIVNFNIPKVEFFTNRKAAGTAWGALHKVSFNTVLAQENVDDFDNTIIHELAHLVVYRLYPLGGKLVGGKFKKVQPHGPEFKKVMAMLGGRPDRCHNYDVSNVQARTRVVEREYEYACGCRKFKLTAIRHNRILQGKSYRCNSCHQKLVPVNTKEVPVSEFKLAA